MFNHPKFCLEILVSFRKPQVWKGVSKLKGTVVACSISLFLSLTELLLFCYCAASIHNPANNTLLFQFSLFPEEKSESVYILALPKAKAFGIVIEKSRRKTVKCHKREYFIVHV